MPAVTAHAHAPRIGTAVLGGTPPVAVVANIAETATPQTVAARKSRKAILIESGVCHLSPTGDACLYCTLPPVVN